MLRLLSKRQHVGFGVRVGYSVEVHAVMEDKGVCPDDGPRSAKRLIEITAIDVWHHCERKP